MLSVLTATILEREEMLERCKASVSRITVPCEHVIVLDDPPSGGPASAIAKANAQARYPWRIILCDDDYFEDGGPEALMHAAMNGDLDFAVGLQGNLDHYGEVHGWQGTWPEPGATGAYIWHERLNAVAELPAESYFAGRTDQAGCDYLLLQRWVAAGARGALFPIKVLAHRAG